MPVLDGRLLRRLFKTDGTHVLHKLKPYSGNPPEGGVAMVLFTIHEYGGEKGKDARVSFNLKGLVVLSDD